MEREIEMTVATERRQAPRITAYLPVRLSLKQGGRYLETLAKDVSVGGIRCLVEGAPLVNDTLFLELPLYKEVLPLQLSARVAWAQQTIPNQCIVGVSFEELSPSDRQLLAAYLERLLATTDRPTFLQ